ncbi:MAG: serine hydrolase domain-containing protein [Gemmatimonadota bacterium]
MKFATMVVAAIGFSAVLAAPSASAAQSLVTVAAPLPDTAAGRRFAEWLEIFNRGDEAALKAYLRTALPADKTAPDLFVDVRSTTGPLIPFRVTAPAPTGISVVLAERDTDSFDEITMLVETAEPHRITLLQPRMIPRPASAPPLPVLSEPQLLAALKTKLDRDTAAGVFSGVLLLAKNGKPIFQYASGLEDRERGIRMTLQSRLGTASIGKMFTTVAVMQLAQAGKIDLDAPVGRYLPDYPNKAVAAKVTVNELLTHTGGTGDVFGEAYDQHRDELRTPADYIAMFGNRDPLFEPGSRRGYSNFGFVVLGRIIEQASGQRWDDYLRHHIFAPTGMAGTGTLPRAVAVPHRAVGYTLVAGKLVSTAKGKGFGASPAGGEYTTVGDLLKFANALTAGRLLDQAHTDLVLRGQAKIGIRSYPYDLSGKAENGAPFIGHQGGGPGANGDLRAFPANGYTLVILSNFGPPWQKFAQFVSNRLPNLP